VLLGQAGTDTHLDDCKCEPSARLGCRVLEKSDRAGGQSSSEPSPDSFPTKRMLSMTWELVECMWRTTPPCIDGPLPAAAV